MSAGKRRQAHRRHRLAVAERSVAQLLAARDGLASGIFFREQVYAAVLAGLHMAELVLAEATGAGSKR